MWLTDASRLSALTAEPAATRPASSAPATIRNHVILYPTQASG